MSQQRGHFTRKKKEIKLLSVSFLSFLLMLINVYMRKYGCTVNSTATLLESHNKQNICGQEFKEACLT